MVRFVLVRPTLIAAALLSAAVALARPASREEGLSVTAVRFWTLGDVTRIAIETTGEFHYLSDRVPNPDRMYFDIIGARPRAGMRGLRTIPVGDARVHQIRVAQTQLAVTRIVLDLGPSAEATASQLSNPDRLVIEIRTTGRAPETAMPRPQTPPAVGPSIYSSPAAPRRRTFIAPRPPQLFALLPNPLPPPPFIETSSLIGAGIPLPPLKTPPPPRRVRTRAAPEFRVSSPLKTKPAAGTPSEFGSSSGAAAREVAERIARDTTGGAGTTSRSTSTRTASSGELVPRAAAKNSDGARSMTRVLGLKIGRIVIDPGHGGHDTGTTGRNGLLEKELVLDVSRRLGRLIAERMGSEVIFTRSDDTFIPLETRTAIANEKRADLFLSVHANSSPLRSIAGTETFYLNFSASKSDLDVAARENASSQKTVYELKDLLQRIALQDKVEESKEFAARVQSSLYSLSSRNNGKQRNRGVKKAPFVVLIGAQMPSILAEIGFVSNPREETLMNRSEHRQKIAEALYKGLAQYAGTLSHFQIAKASDE